MKGTNINDEAIKVNMFGEFRIRYRGSVIGDKSPMTHQIRLFLEYLIANRNQNISAYNLIDVLWHNNAGENPTNALKNLVYRTRNLLSGSGIPSAKKLIVFKEGSYCWNNSYPLIIDTEEFEDCCKKACDADLSENERISYCINAMDIFKGDFLPDACYEEWAMELSRHYKSCALKAIYQIIDILSASSRYDEIIMLCERAILIEKYDEGLHIFLMTAMHKMGQDVSALEHYHYVAQMLYSELGIEQSHEMKQIYLKIIGTTHHAKSSLAQIVGAMENSDISRGPILLEYEVFKKFYRLRCGNKGESVAVCLFTITGYEQSLPQIGIVKIAMINLYDAICEVFRNTDIITRYSRSQFIIVLEQTTYKSANELVARASDRFKAIYDGNEVKLISSIQMVKKT